MEAPKDPENKLPRKTGSVGTSRNTAILVLCVGIAAFLWLLIKLTDSYNWRVPVTLTYSNLPNDRVAVRELPKKSEIMVNATGFKILLARFRIIQITLPISYRENMNQPFVLANELENELAGDLPLGYELLSFSPDTIYLQFEKKISKKVPIVINGTISYAKQYEGRGLPVLSPDSVTVSGPESILDTLQQWYTDPLMFKEITESKKGEIALQKPYYSSISLEQLNVNYSIEVEAFTQLTREIEIELVNVPINKQITPYPKTVKVFVHVGLSNLEAARNANITATADFENVNLKKDRFVEVKLSGYPDYLKISGFEPFNIEFIVYN
jgi:hypothetical protein